MDTHSTNQFNSNSSQTCSSSSPHKLLRWWKPQSKWCSPTLSTTPPDLAVPTTLPAPQLKSPQPQEEVTSSSPKEDGNALSARTTISRVERSAIDARRPSPAKIPMECQLTCNNQLLKKTPKGKQCKRLFQLNSAPPVSRSPLRELVTGPARGAATITLLSETLATNATWATSSPAKCSTLNNKTKLNNNKNTSLSSQCKTTIAKPRLDSKPKSNQWTPALQLGFRHSWQKVTPQKYLSSENIKLLETNNFK